MRIKTIPEDFIVKEIINLNFTNGPYSYFKLKKKKWNTLDAIKEIAKRLNLKEKNFNFAGIKDRQAITEQIISIQNVTKHKLENLKIKDLELEYLGNGKERINTSLLEGNSFEITIRDLDKINKKTIKTIPNYFDSQRFGKYYTNHKAGKCLVKKEFKKACEYLELNPKNNDFVGTLRKNKRLLKLIFSSYQSYLFNLALSQHIKNNSQEYDTIETPYGELIFSDFKDDTTFPLLNFDTEFKPYQKEIFQNILKKEEISKKDLIIKQIPSLVSLSKERQSFVKVKKFSSEIKKDEINPGKLKQIIKFELPKGSYATILIKSLYRDF